MICKNANWTNVANLQEWINPVWYNDYTEFMAMTQMTMAQVTLFYTPSNASGSFGMLLQDNLEYLYNKYDCPSATDMWPTTTAYKNCSGDFLANMQWGSSAITLDAPYNSSEYFP